MNNLIDKENKASVKRFDHLEWQNQQRMRQYAREERKALAENHIVPLVTQWTAAADNIAPPDHDIYAVPRGTTVTTNRRRRERHPIASGGGFVMLARGQIVSLLSEKRFARSGAAQALFLRLLSCTGFGGDVDPVAASVANIASEFNITRQHVYTAYDLLYELDLIRPRDPNRRWFGWLLNPAVAFLGDSQLFLEREAEFLQATPKAEQVQRRRSGAKARRSQRAKNSKKVSTRARKRPSSTP